MVALIDADIVAEKLPAEGGVNVTQMEQVEFPANVLPQLLVWLKAPGLIPANENPYMVSEPLLALSSSTCCALLATPTV
jgi:hypothetical protein